MKVFFQIKFSITAKEETQIEEELSNYVLTWLESKYGVAAKRAISACKSLLSDSEFGDPNGLFVETVHYEDVKYAQHNLWACKVMEPPKRWGKFVPRRWATEVGYEQTSDKSADISYSVRYDDIASNGEKRAPRPQFNLPKLAEMLISSEKWICTANGEVLHATNYQQHVGPVFGIDECRAAKEQALNAGEDKMDKHWISLCKVNRPDKNRDIWMLRLADAVGGVLVAPYFDKQKEQIHDNRLFVFCDDGPTEPGRIGFWEWEEFESEPGRWKTTSTYMEQASPVEVIVLDEVSNIEGVIMSLKSGLKIPSYAHGKIIFAAKNDTGFEGVLCDTGESLLRQRNPELVALRDDIYTLPYYKLNKSDIFEWKYEWESRKIYKYISLREPQKRIPIYPISETIKNIFLSSMGWPIFKAQAILKNDYLKFREALASIPKESILERVADTYGISIQEAQTYVDEFLQMVEKYMTVEDVDSAVITRILSKHGGLWQKCNDIAYNKWIADHANEVNTAQEELAALQHKVAQAENDVSSAKEKHGDILREVAEAQDDLCRLQAEIARYKILEKETVAAIREKIAGAQKNVAGFIADLSILLPQATSNESGWKYRHISAVYPEDEVGVSKDWKDELNELSQNLSYSLNVEPDLATMLAAFLYSAHIHNAPILIAGPCGQDIANALSVSLYADNAGQLMFGEQFDCDIADAVNNVNEHIVAAQNMFGKGWGDKSQYFGKSPILLSAVQNKLDQEGILYQKPYIESSPAYKSELNGIQKSSKLPDWVKAYFDALANADLGVHSSPFCHQVEALEAAFAGKDLFVSTGTGSGKTECFMWPLLAKLAAEARNTPANWSMRGVRTIIMYPMNALVSDQVSRLRRLIGDSEHRFVNAFRETCGEDSRRPQFGMYTGRTPYAGKEPKRSADRSLVATYSEMLNAETNEEKAFLQKLIKDGKFPVKEDFHEFLRKLYDSKHIPDDEDAELVTRFEMQRFCPDILITNYSMLEYMLLRPIESKIWADTQNWLNADSNNKLLFVIDEAHMYRGSAGGEVSFLIRRLFHRLGIDRSRVQFILTTASMPNKNEEDRRVIQTFANDLTASDDGHEFHYLAGQQEEIGSGRA